MQARLVSCQSILCNFLPILILRCAYSPSQVLDRDRCCYRGRFPASLSSVSYCRVSVRMSLLFSLRQDVADSNGYSIVENFCGHGTGRYIHMDPLVRESGSAPAPNAIIDSMFCSLQVYHFRNNQKRRLEPGMVFTIEPILAEGSGDIYTWEDGWTAATRDGGW